MAILVVFLLRSKEESRKITKFVNSVGWLKIRFVAWKNSYELKNYERNEENNVFVWISLQT